MGFWFSFLSRFHWLNIIYVLPRVRQRHFFGCLVLPRVARWQYTMSAKKRGRPKGRTKSPITLRIGAESFKALKTIQRLFGWTKVGSVERALLFAATHPQFGPRVVAVVSDREEVGA